MRTHTHRHTRPFGMTLSHIATFYHLSSSREKRGYFSVRMRARWGVINLTRSYNSIMFIVSIHNWPLPATALTAPQSKWGCHFLGRRGGVSVHFLRRLEVVFFWLTARVTLVFAWLNGSHHPLSPAQKRHNSTSARTNGNERIHYLAKLLARGQLLERMAWEAFGAGKQHHGTAHCRCLGQGLENLKSHTRKKRTKLSLGTNNGERFVSLFTMPKPKPFRCLLVLRFFCVYFLCVCVSVADVSVWRTRLAGRLYDYCFGSRMSNLNLTILGCQHSWTPFLHEKNMQQTEK